MHLHYGLLMAVSMDDRFALQFRRLRVLRLLLQELAQQKRLSTESLRFFVMWKDIDQFITKNRGTTRFQTNYRCTGLNVRTKCRKDLPQQAFCLVEEAVLIERSAATERLLRHN